MQTISVSTSAVVMRLLIDANKVLDADRAAAKSFITQATALLREQHNPVQPAERVGKTVSRGGLAQWQILKVNAYVAEHLDSGIRAATLAGLSRLSASYFPVAFKQSFGEPLHAHLRRRRVERAKELMLTTDLPLGQIALDCGFCDQGHFCRVFRRLTGVAPNQWRNQRPARAA